MDILYGCHQRHLVYSTGFRGKPTFANWLIKGQVFGGLSCKDAYLSSWLEIAFQSNRTATGYIQSQSAQVNGHVSSLKPFEF